MPSNQFQEHIEATKSLINFCAKYEYKHVELAHIENCLNNLTNGNIGKAKENYREVSLGGMGTFTDWSHDSNEVNNEFSSLVKKWSTIMYQQV